MMDSCQVSFAHFDSFIDWSEDMKEFIKPKPPLRILNEGLVFNDQLSCIRRRRIVVKL